MSLASWRLTVTVPRTQNSSSPRYGNRVRFAAEALPNHANGGPNDRKKKVVVVGSGWAGLGAANHLCNQGFDVTVLGGDNGFGGLEDVGIRAYWYPYRNIFSLVDELGIKPFTNWTKTAQYSEDGLEVEFPIFQDLPQLPTPLGTLLYTQFLQLPLADRLTSLPLLAAAIDFDNTDTAWRKYDSITARELFKQFGCSERFYKKVIGPLLQVGLFAPAEQCSGAATLGMLYYIILAHQKDFDLLWCRGTVREKIFGPWFDSLRTKGCEFAEGRKVTDFSINEETGSISAVICGREVYDADAVLLAVGISTLQDLIKNSVDCGAMFSAVLYTRQEFLKVLNLNSIDVLTVKIWLDRKVNIPYASNACSGFGGSFGWTFSHLNTIYDEHKDNPVSVLQADFYHANELLPQKDEYIVTKVKSYLSKFIKDLETAAITENEIKRFPKSLPHFFPGSYKYTIRGPTTFPNLFVAGDWIVNRHGSWAQEKSYVTGLEAANLVVDYLEEGSFAKIIPAEEDEPHIEALRSLNRRFNEIRAQLPLSDYFL
ncbi:NAD(P)-binding domain containing protein [Trema orientale]|uniref:NAD(P)-binding domain containing protein n=1 Tax=Trema orientale TaxID=63057 RepID=A0A2P5EWN1_TREOI|nr:NAD(P)-binding domain containing protein [Trema orientale]